MVSLDIAGHGGRNKFPHLGWHLTSSNPSHTQQQQQRKYDLLQMLKTYVDRESMINISAGKNNGSTVRCIFQLCNKYVLLNTLNHSPLTLKTT